MTAVPFSVIIPARYASTRLPGKPLADILGKPMVVWVAEQAVKSGAARVVVATDDARIEAAVAAYGIQTILTRDDHSTGTDRLSEAVQQLGLPDEEIVVNVQGDEPLIDPAVIRSVAARLAEETEKARKNADSPCAISTAAYPITAFAEWQNPNVVKVVCDQAGRALYFSRAPIPFPRDATGLCHEKVDFDRIFSRGKTPLRHLGIYAYRAHFLKQFPQLVPAPLEELECLEQLRALFYGYRIAVVLAPTLPGLAVDTAEDLAKVRQLLDRHLSTQLNAQLDPMPNPVPDQPSF